MKNLKRALSLTMASVMLVGMMAVGASAAGTGFTDKDKIENKDAVNMLVELGILAGKEDGNFDPAGILKRGEFAKMVSIALNGGNDVVIGTSPKSSYTDMEGKWSAPYVEYCTTMGIVSGVGEGRFSPEATVTGAQAAKMLLVSLGYNAANEKTPLTGANWALNTNVIASSINLYDGIKFDPNAPLTRDNAAQLVNNALNASLVKYEGGEPTAITTTSTELVEKVSTVDPTQSTWVSVTTTVDKTMLNTKYGVQKLTGVLKATDKVALKGATLADENYVNIGGKSVKTTADWTMLGQQVSVYVVAKDLSGISYDKVKGSVAADLGNKVTVHYGDGKKVEFKGADDKATYNLAGAGVGDVKNTAVVNVNFGAYKTAPVDGAPVYVIENADKTVYVNVYEYNYGKITEVNTAKETIKLNGTTVKNADFIATAELAKDDMVLTFTANKKTIIKVVDKMDGTLTGASKGKAVIDGKLYGFAGFGGAETVITENGLVTAGNLNKDKTFYVFEDLVLGIKDGEKAAAKYAVVVEAGFTAGKGDTFNGETKAQAKVTLEDGTTAIYDVASADTFVYNKNASNEAGVTDKATFAANVVPNTLYTYTVNTAGKIKLAKVITDGTVVTGTITSGSYKTGDTKLAKTTGSVYLDENTLFMFNSKDGYKTYVGTSNAPTINTLTGKGAMYVTDDSTIASVMIVTDKTTATGESGKFGYVVSVGRSFDADDAEVITFNLYNGEEVAIKSDIKGTYTEQVKKYQGNVIKYSIADGAIDVADVAATGAAIVGKTSDFRRDAAVTGFKQGTVNYVTFAANTTGDKETADDVTYDLAEDFAVHTIDGDGVATSGTDLSKNDIADQYVVYTTNGDGEVNAVYYIAL